MDGFLRRHNAASLAELSALGEEALPAETLRFVPQFVAAATVMAHGDETALTAQADPDDGARSAAAAGPPSSPGRTLRTRPIPSEKPLSLGARPEPVRSMRRITP